MPSRFLPVVQIGLGLIATAALLLYAVWTGAADLAFWLFALVFLVFIGFDIALHVRALRSADGGRPPEAR
jgi:hypothetical protein